MSSSYYVFGTHSIKIRLLSETTMLGKVEEKRKMTSCKADGLGYNSNECTTETPKRQG